MRLAVARTDRSGLGSRGRSATPEQRRHAADWAVLAAGFPLTGTEENETGTEPATVMRSLMLGNMSSRSNVLLCVLC